MTEARSPAETQAEVLLEELRQDEKRRCRELIKAAETEATVLVRQARRDATTRMHKAVQEERSRASRSLQKAAAQLQTRARRRHQVHARQIAKESWGLLPDALRRRWADPAARRLWCDVVVTEALQRLGPDTWQVEHPVGWDPAELGELLGDLGDGMGDRLAFVARDDFPAGLRICAGSACLDGTIDGLLADRDHIEGQLLAEFDRAAGASGPPGPTGAGEADHE
jgi:hypothetical protein